MTEIEQIVAEALDSLARATHLSAWDKWQITTRIEEMAAKASHEFIQQDEDEMDRRFAETDAKYGIPA
jgi:hypothetical protein